MNHQPSAVAITGTTLEALTHERHPDFDTDSPAQVWEVRADGDHYTARQLAAGHNLPVVMRLATEAPNRHPNPVLGLGVTITGTVWTTDAYLDALTDENTDEIPPMDQQNHPDAYPHRAVKVITYCPRNDCAEGYVIERADGTPSPVIVATVTPSPDDELHPYLSAALAHRRTSTTQTRAVQQRLAEIARRAGFDPDDPVGVLSLMTMLTAGALPEDIRAELEDLTRDAMNAADCPPIEDTDEN